MERNQLGMMLFIASESIFFLLLILAYVTFHKATGAQAAAVLDPYKTGVFSIALISSSLTLWFAEVARERGSKWFAGWLFMTILLGGIFLFGQGTEYAHLFHENITISRDLFGSTFFTLTGFHGFHVFFGLLLLTSLLGLAVWGQKHEPAMCGIKSIALYWHFVDAVWIVIFSIVYLWRFV
ncbi:MAG TPA: heme-copper oxidase subunit III [Planktothrix sp.]|jgi:heme/copper-type cytochrome/quinol oxidase subunit 3